MEIIRERRRVTERWNRIHFDLNSDQNSGYVFDADENWNPAFNKDYEEIQSKNYQYCLEHPEKYTMREAVEEHSWTEPAVGRCYCGNEVELIDEYMGACKCEKCGQWYNVFGQRLIDPEYWEEGNDW